MIPLSSQVYSFLLTLLIGLGIGLFYDLYCELRYYLKLKKTAGHVSDFLIWVVITVFTYVSLLFGNWGEIKFYIILGLILGAILYLKVFGKILTPIITKIFSLILQGLKFIVTIILWPFQLLIKIILIPLGFVGMLFGKIKRIIYRIVWKLFGKPINRVVLKYKRFYARLRERVILRLLRILNKKR